MTDSERYQPLCSNFEPHVWKRSKCKNCFHSKTEHKALTRRDTLRDLTVGRDDPSLHLDFVDGLNLSEHDMTPRMFEGNDKSRKDYKDELKLLRRERKEIASKQAELRETMLRMEIQMHDYKETKQENDILTKDIQLMKKDLREVTLGAAKACEANENLRKDIAKLKKMVVELGGDPRDIHYSSHYDSESASDNNLPSTIQKPKPLQSPPKIPKVTPPPRRKNRGDVSESEDTLQLLLLSPRSGDEDESQKPMTRNVRERMARMEELLSSLRGVCISIANTPPNVRLFFIIILLILSY